MPLFRVIFISFFGGYFSRSAFDVFHRCPSCNCRTTVACPAAQVSTDGDLEEVSVSSAAQRWLIGAFVVESCALVALICCLKRRSRSEDVVVGTPVVSDTLALRAKAEASRVRARQLALR